ncbi:DUF624 domain-containing protein [Micromonospora aurantiaca (nom. illeg.)]|uniref:DUF624 domain-containing protein n=1 Tax=Micromonospora aurantiaca (nom. illeg.) TaxID=47850 RepID=UPI000F40B3AF|nr:DUF624 domain-containing protein [Micromonospora aurantiaca]RNI07034.1 DUF624 domain-containing protein [Micromonospora aurantiaca]
MTGATGGLREFGDGPLSRAAARVHILLVVELLLLVSTLPGLAVLVLLDRDSSNLPLVAAAALPLGPAVSAALHTLRHQRPDLTDLRPAATFLRAYRANLAGVLRVWAPTLLWLAVIAVNLANLPAAAVPGWWAVPLVVVGAGVILVGVNALVIVSLFTFRTRDVLRLAVYYVARKPGVTVGNVALLAAVAGVTAVFSEAVLALLAALLVLALLRIGDPMIDEIRAEFTA